MNANYIEFYFDCSSPWTYLAFNEILSLSERNNLEIINIFTAAGKINENAPKEFIGLDRFEARKRILKD